MMIGLGVPRMRGMRPLSLIRPSRGPAGRQRLTADRRELAAVVPHLVSWLQCVPAAAWRAAVRCHRAVMRR